MNTLHKTLNKANEFGLGQKYFTSFTFLLILRFIHSHRHHSESFVQNLRLQVLFRLIGRQHTYIVKEILFFIHFKGTIRSYTGHLMNI